LSALEEEQQSAQTQRDLFTAPQPEPEQEASAVERSLAHINPDALSPKEALDALYRLKNLLRCEPQT
jgi:DNA mismatch repair protein MutS